MIFFSVAVAVSLTGWWLIFAKNAPIQIEAACNQVRRWAEINSINLKIYVGGFIISTLIFLFTKVLVLALISLVFTVALPGSVVNSHRKKTISKKADAWPYLMDDLSSAIRAGMTLSDSLLDVAKNAPVSLEIEMNSFSSEYRKMGQIGPALNALSKKISDPIGNLVVRMLFAVVRSGANDLAKSLKILSDAIRDQEQIHREIRARQSWVINSARLAVISPWVVLLAIWSQPTVQTAYQSTQGQMILLLVAAICFLAYLLMKRMAMS
jgi:tight adherence protein B